MRYLIYVAAYCAVSVLLALAGTEVKDRGKRRNTEKSVKWSSRIAAILMFPQNRVNPIYRVIGQFLASAASRVKAAWNRHVDRVLEPRFAAGSTHTAWSGTGETLKLVSKAIYRGKLHERVIRQVRLIPINGAWFVQAGDLLVRDSRGYTAFTLKEATNLAESAMAGWAHSQIPCYMGAKAYGVAWSLEKQDRGRLELKLNWSEGAQRQGTIIYVGANLANIRARGVLKEGIDPKDMVEHMRRVMTEAEVSLLGGTKVAHV